MRYKKVSTLSFLCIVISFLLCQSAYATTMKRLGITELTKGSSHVVQCKIKTIKSSWNEERTLITTEIELDVSEVVKGTISEKTILLKMPGGTIDGRTTVVVGAPSFDVGEEVVLFLKRMDKRDVAARDQYGLVGLSQGKFSVQYDKVKKTTVAVSNARKFGLSLMPEQAGGTKIANEKERFSLDELFTQIKNVKSN
ncbi:MAG: hypothetical protein ABR936_12400 [Bacteroidota bacterium]